eukprot:1325091-Prymnesium_polylepis.1
MIKATAMAAAAIGANCEIGAVDWASSARISLVRMSTMTTAPGGNCGANGDEFGTGEAGGGEAGGDEPGGSTGGGNDGGDGGGKGGGGGDGSTATPARVATQTSTTLNPSTIAVKFRGKALD